LQYLSGIFIFGISGIYIGDKNKIVEMNLTEIIYGRIIIAKYG